MRKINAQRTMEDEEEVEEEEEEERANCQSSKGARHDSTQCDAAAGSTTLLSLASSKF
jgi:hypothetical protein